MDFKKIFLKDACPTAIGGQAVIEGVMMRGPERTGTALRLPDGRIYLKTEKNPVRGKLRKMPLIRGVFSFIDSLVIGMKIITFSADVQEFFEEEAEREKAAAKAEAAAQQEDREAPEGAEQTAAPEEPEKEDWLTRKLGPDRAWKLMMAGSVIFAIAIAVGVFILLPTVLVNWLGRFIKSSIALNLIEGGVRILMFIAYVWAISRMEDIKRLFQYHGAEHKTIHCFENGQELTPQNAITFERLHPRCGTSFVMFVLVISLILFSLLGWPSLVWRLLSRILLIPVVAALSYELLRWAGRSNNKIVEILSVPGLLLQKLTTRDPDESQLEIAICAMKSVMVPEDAAYIEGIVDKDATLIEERRVERE